MRSSLAAGGVSPVAQKWSAKTDVLEAHAHPEQIWNTAVVVGEPSSNELVALAFGYSPERTYGRARMIAAAPDLVAALKLSIIAFEFRRGSLTGHDVLALGCARAAIAKALGQADAAERQTELREDH